MDLKRLIFPLAAATVGFAMVGCAGDDIGDDRTKVGTTVSIAEKGDKVDSTVFQEPDLDAIDEAIEAPLTTVDRSAELAVISEQTDAFLTALKAGDINALCDMLEPSSTYYKFFDRNRQSAQLSKILQTDFGDMVWTHWSQTDNNNKNWLESTYAENGQYTRSYVLAGVKEMLFYDEYFLLNFSKGQSVNQLYKSENEDGYFKWIQSTLDRMPLVRNNWAFKCTVPDAEGKVLFNIDDDYIFDYTQILSLDEVADEKKVQTYSDKLAESRGTIEDVNATFDQSPELREKFAQLIREKKFEEAWQLTKDLDKDGFFDDRTTYDDLADAGRSRVDEFIAEHVVSVVCDHSTQVYDASRRRHVFTQIYYDAIAGDDELEIEDWLSDNHIKDCGEAVYFDITEDQRLATALGGYFDIIAKLG